MKGAILSRPSILKRFVAVGDRLVHYRTAGEGPPALLLHDSVKSSSYLIPLINQLSPHFRVFALDTPGYGNSDPLPGQPEIADFARAVKDTMEALGLNKVCLYGRHTSSKIVLELLCNWPELFDVGVMDGLSFADPPNSEAFIARYLPPFEIDDQGAYLARTWTQIQDMTRWFPWFSKQAAARMAVPVRDAAAGHSFALDFLMAGPNYASAYGAAFRYVGWPRLRALGAEAPAVFVTAEDDVLYPFLDKIPDTRVKERVPPGAPAVLERVEQIFRRSTSGGQSPLPAPQPRQRSYLDRANGQIHVRQLGLGDAPPTLFLHETPGGAASATPFLNALAKFGPVIAPDLPGGGESDPLDRADAADYADALAELVQSVAGGPVNVFAITTATPLAIAFAERHPQLVRAIILDGYLGPDPAMAEQFCPPIAFDNSGAHLHQLWHLLRNRTVQWPWYAAGVEAIRWVDAEPSGLRLHRALIDVLKQLPSYGDATRAALHYDSAEALPNLSCPVLALTVERDPAYAQTPASTDNVTIAPRASGAEERAIQASGFFRSSDNC